MFALLKLIPLRDWFYVAAIVALVVFGLYEHAHLIDAGIQREKIAVAAQSAAAQARAQQAIMVDQQQHAAAVAATVKQYAKRDAANRRQLSADAQRLREYDAYRHSHPALARPTSPGVAGAVGNPRAPDYQGVFESLETVALGLTSSNRVSDNALTACQQERASLIGR